MFGDKTRLRQVVINLVSNAAKFTHHGGVWIDCQWDAGDAGEKWFVIRITDSGIGIPREQIPKLFEKFHQVDASSTRRYSGTGLGLAISRRLCEMMGGSISVESELGSGSTFTVRLPARPAEAGARHNPSLSTIDSHASSGPGTTC